jgi:hypothetical protein
MADILDAYRYNRPVAQILIRGLSNETKEALLRRAARHGRSLQAELREVLERLASEEIDDPECDEPFGSWLMRISRPGVDLTEVLERLRGK